MVDSIKPTGVLLPGPFFRWETISFFLRSNSGRETRVAPGLQVEY
jgi:hypothetical protein